MITIEKEDCIKLDNQLCFPLYACAKEVVRLYRKPLEALGLTYTQYLVMMLLWENGEMTEGDLGKKLHLDSGTLAPLLKRLEKQGFINRSRLESNERKLLLTLTKEGEKLKEKAMSVPEEMNGCIPLSEKELGILKGLLNKALLKMTG
ncbi:MarR family winged helix-turn-helix transcriptional regulator [Ruminococcus sp.]|uniref:MarR family winged helix-turn-helix transcriptional regulator n=1 Tax=Ruminococcus sp. TaxID=41978 RepID=UPI00388D263E